jgi:L-rhamnonate dehydratase
MPAGGVDFSEKAKGNWLNSRMATPMSGYPEYRDSNLTWGRNVIGSFVVEVESRSGEVGVGVSTGGVPCCWIVENHMAPLVEGRKCDEIAKVWDILWKATLYYGRKGLAVNALSALDLALWDLTGKLRGEPVYAMLSRNSRKDLPLYATTPRPDLAEQMGFIGGKLPLKFGPADGDAGLAKNLQLAEEMRAKTGKDFFLAYDAWMALDVEYSLKLSRGLADRGFWFLEDFLIPDDYWGFSDVRREAPPGFLIATGEHESTVYGFRMLIDLKCCDIIQPDVSWCGGLTELVRIADYAEAANILLVPHASSVFGYHFMMSRPKLPFGEFVVVSDDADKVVPMYGPLFTNEPLPERGKITLSERPGFGVDLNRDQKLTRPFTHSSAGITITSAARP